MYFPATRVLTVLELLQSRQRISGPELATRLEVDTRTVRRYIMMLQDLGVPVEAERGRYGSYRRRSSACCPRRCAPVCRQYRRRWSSISRLPARYRITRWL
jgi:biotin operon repressor